MSSLPSVPASQRASPPAPFPPWQALLDEQRERSAKRAWQVAGAASVIAFAAVVGLVSLAPYRRYIPYLLAVDKAHGNVEYVGLVNAVTVKDYQEILDKHWVERYIVARESYYYRLLQDDYDMVMEMSEGEAASDYAQEYEGPKAKDKRYGDRIEAKVTVISIQLFSNAIGNQATVRFSKTIRQLDTRVTEAPQYAVVTLAYRYHPSMFAKEQATIRNPLGFKTSAYRVATELASPEPASDKSAPRLGE